MSPNLDPINQWLNGGDAPVDIVNTDKGVYIYGAGELGRLALEYCEACDITIRAFLDRATTESVVSRSGNEYLVFPPDTDDDTLDKSLPMVVAIATSPFGPIADQLQKLNWKSVIPFYNLTNKERRGHPLKNGWRLGNVSLKEKETVKFVCENWADEISLIHYEAFLAWHRSNTEVALESAPINSSERYAIPELLRALQERRGQFVDVGSHRGESIARLNAVGLTFSDYKLFEPDSKPRSILEARNDELVPIGSNVDIYPDVLGEDESHMNFQEGLGYCSQLWVKGEELRSVVRLDNFDLRPDFLKVHTEGSESLILKGATKTIDRYRPVIAYSVYHRREGFYSDISEVMSLCKNYKCYFRLHSYQGTGAFVYGIPSV